jgi:hypothetical protein
MVCSIPVRAPADASVYVAGLKILCKECYGASGDALDLVEHTILWDLATRLVTRHVEQSHFIGETKHHLRYLHSEKHIKSGICKQLL